MSLIEQENQEYFEAKKKSEDKVRKVTLEIAEILEREDLTCGEWGEVVELFSQRIGGFVSNTKFKKTELTI